MNDKKPETLLIRPPTTFIEGSIAEDVELPVGMLSMAAFAEKKGYPVEVYDANIEFDLNRLNASSERYVIGASRQEIEKRISRKKYDIAGISNMFYAQLPDAVDTAKLTKKIHPDCLVVIGGPHSSVAGEEILRGAPEIDIAVAGEGEETFTEILEWKMGQRELSSIKGICYRENGTIRTNERRRLIEDLDKLPMPAYHLVDIKKYFKSIKLNKGKWVFKEHRVFPILTSRGCPYGCIFCTIHLHMGRRARFHSVDYVMDNIKYAIDNFGVEHLYFIDDNVSMNRERFIGILRGIIKLNEQGHNIVWQTPNGTRVDTLDEEILRLAKASGVKSLILAVESGDQEILDRVINKKLSLGKVLEVARLCRKLKIRAKAGFIMGLPGETIESFKKTVEFARMLRDKYGIKSAISTATPYKGTKLYDICVEKNYLTKELTPEVAAISNQGKGIIQTEDFTVDDVRRYREALKKKSFLKRFFRCQFLSK